MSWSFYGVGKPQAVLQKARKELTACECSELEETIKGKVLDILEVSLRAYPEESAVSIKAGGSQSVENGKLSNTLSFNTLSFTIENLYGFVT